MRKDREGAEMTNIEKAFLLFTQFAHIVEALLGEREDIFLAHDIRPADAFRKARKLQQNLHELGFEVFWQVTAADAGYAPPGHKRIMALFALLPFEHTNETPLTQRSTPLIARIGTPEAIERGLEPEPDPREGGVLPPEENDTFIASLGITPPTP